MAINLFFALVTGVALLCSCHKEGAQNNKPPGTDTVMAAEKPALTGKIVYHRYDSYGDSSRMYLYDSKNELQEISAPWQLFDPMNAHFNNDGSKIIFMAQAVKDGKWDIYLWETGSTSMPMNLTKNDGCRDEDPKFSADGKWICFKKTAPSGTGNIAVLNMADLSVRTVTNNTVESGMPYFSADGTRIIYAQGSGSGHSDIYMVNIDGSGNTVLQGIENIEEYYPIGNDSASYFFSRWSARTNAHDQVYRGFYSGKAALRLPFNTSDADYSDAFPCGDRFVIISCDKSGGLGAYDLYIADLSSTQMWPLTDYNKNINSPLNELGACYH